MTATMTLAEKNLNYARIIINHAAEMAKAHFDVETGYGIARIDLPQKFHIEAVYYGDGQTDYVLLDEENVMEAGSLVVTHSIFEALATLERGLNNS